MAVSLDDRLVVGVSSRALFNLEEENAVFETQGLEAYCAYQLAHEKDLLAPGVAFPLIKRLHQLNDGEKRLTEIIVMSKNSADTSLRIFHSIEHYGLDITRAALVSGRPIVPYFSAFRTDLFLSANEEDVREALAAGFAAGLIVGQPLSDRQTPDKEIRIAFDGDAVIFSDEAERIYQEKGLAAFEEHEKRNAEKPLPEGPFAKLLKTVSYLQERYGEQAPIRTALVTARNAPAHERVIRTLRAWHVRIDEVFFLGGMKKSDVLAAFGADIYFDDQTTHLQASAGVVPSARVPYGVCGQTNKTV